jgi:hypothetical protein
LSRVQHDLFVPHLAQERAIRAELYRDLVEYAAIPSIELKVFAAVFTDEPAGSTVDAEALLKVRRARPHVTQALHDESAHCDVRW